MMNKILTVSLRGLEKWKIFAKIFGLGIFLCHAVAWGQSWSLGQAITNIENINTITPEDVPNDTTILTESLPSLPGAQLSVKELENAARAEEKIEFRLTAIIQRTIDVLAGLAAAIAVLAIVAYSVRLIFSVGDTDQHGRAKRGIIWALISLIIIIFAYIIVKTVIRIAYIGSEGENDVVGVSKTDINREKVSPPYQEDERGDYLTTDEIVLKTDTKEAIIRYKIHSCDEKPSVTVFDTLENSNKEIVTILFEYIKENCVYAYAEKEGFEKSDMRKFDFKWRQLPEPIFHPEEGEISRDSQINISGEPEAKILYKNSLNEEFIPYTSNPLFPPSKERNSVTYEAYQTKEGYKDSKKAIAEYTFPEIKDFKITETRIGYKIAEQSTNQYNVPVKEREINTVNLIRYQTNINFSFAFGTKTGKMKLDIPTDKLHEDKYDFPPQELTEDQQVKTINITVYRDKLCDQFIPINAFDIPESDYVWKDGTEAVTDQKLRKAQPKIRENFDSDVCNAVGIKTSAKSCTVKSIQDRLRELHFYQNINEYHDVRGKNTSKCQEVDGKYGNCTRAALKDYRNVCRQAPRREIFTEPRMPRKSNDQ